MPQEEIKFADNSTPIPEPLLSNVKKYWDKELKILSFVGVPSEENSFLDGAQYMYNLRQVYVGELEKSLQEHKDRIKELRMENEKYRGKINLDV